MLPNHQVDAFESLIADAQRLREVDPARFMRVVALVRAYVAIYDRDLESDEVFASRCAQILSNKTRMLS